MGKEKKGSGRRLLAGSSMKKMWKKVQTDGVVLMLLH
jgi:hypothetical protein